MAAAALVSGCGPSSTEGVRANLDAEPPEVTWKDFGDYVLHFNSISTANLQPNVAKEYNIARSKNRALLTVSIIKKEPGTLGVSVEGTVTVTANNLTGQAKNLSLRPIREGDTFYYIGDLPVANAETLVFAVAATPANEKEMLEVRFLRQFYVD